jgi:hypothetical protein
MTTDRERLDEIDRLYTDSGAPGGTDEAGEMSEHRFTIGDRVEKFTGDYQLSGEVRAVFMTTRGKVRYVVEHDCGILHIYSETNLRVLNIADCADGS